jgi:hypothetical protein
MGEAASNMARKVVAILILVVAAWILLKIVIGAVTAVAWIVAAVVAVVAILWAISQL